MFFARTSDLKPHGIFVAYATEGRALFGDRNTLDEAAAMTLIFAQPFPTNIVTIL